MATEWTAIAWTLADLIIGGALALLGMDVFLRRQSARRRTRRHQQAVERAVPGRTLSTT